MLDSCQNIIWDFDGVIIDSNSVREFGFVKTLETYPLDQVDQLLEFHNKNGGLSRYVKFRYFFEKIRKERISTDRVNELAATFSTVMMERLLDPNLLISDSVEFIRKNFRNKRMHIASGSDHEELNKICDRLSLKKYFLSIDGSPTPKNEIVRNILESYEYNQKETCLIGDSTNDYDAARTNGIQFYGYNNLELNKLPAEYITSFK
ncbi:HAD family hydrolase [Ekhidna sp.]|uniref:HAD family hydrolase n=1 Tax=Ekhidna sp. TaxID=2608089 RepID=UPI00351396A4